MYLIQHTKEGKVEKSFQLIEFIDGKIEVRGEHPESIPIHEVTEIQGGDRKLVVTYVDRGEIKFIEGSFMIKHMDNWIIQTKGGSVYIKKDKIEKVTHD